MFDRSFFVYVVSIDILQNQNKKSQNFLRHNYQLKYAMFNLALTHKWQVQFHSFDANM